MMDVGLAGAGLAEEGLDMKQACRPRLCVDLWAGCAKKLRQKKIGDDLEWDVQ